MHRVTVAIMFSVFLAFSHAQRRHIPRPVCQPMQSCSYSDSFYTFELCDCPGFTGCGKGPGFTHTQDGTTYKFCTPRELPICKPQEVANSVSGILTSIYCQCDEGLNIVKGPVDPDGTAHFTCGVPEFCNAGGYCGSLDQEEEYIMEECQCPKGTECISDPPLFWIFSRKTASCMPAL